MQFLKTLFWVVLTILLVLFAKANWTMVPINLWGGIIVELKLPILILAAFLVGFLPPYLVYRARLWTMRRQAGAADAQVVGNVAPSVATNGEVRSEEERLATDSKAWPA
jgi:uncharacterized integral membrane protein